MNEKTSELGPIPNTEQPVKQSPVKQSPDIPLMKGMKLSFGNRLCKVTASRPNGKVTLKYIRRLEDQ